MLELIGGQVALAPDVAQLEARIVVAGILVVDQPYPLTVVDEVRCQQVVVTGDRGGVGRPQYPADVVELAGEVAVGGGQSETAFPDDAQVAGLAFEHVEPAPKRRPPVQHPAPVRHPGEHVGLLKVGVGQGRALEEADQQDAQVGAIVDDRGPDAGPFGGPAVVVLAGAVDTEQCRCSQIAARDVGRRGRADLDVAIGQSAVQFLEPARLAGQGREFVEQPIQVRVVEERHAGVLAVPETGV